MSINLQERIGIDRSVLCDFIIKEVDTNKIEKSAKANNNKSYSKIVYDDTTLQLFEMNVFDTLKYDRILPELLHWQ